MTAEVISSGASGPHNQAAEAALMMAQAEDTLRSLRGLLSSGLERDPRVFFESFRAQETYEPFSPPADLAEVSNAPRKEDFIARVKPTTLFEKMTLGGGRYKRELADADRRFAEALDTFRAAGSRHAERLSALRAAHDAANLERVSEIRRLNARVDEIESSFRLGAMSEVATYFLTVLERSPYPAGFPHVHCVQYVPESKELIVECELPPPTIVPRASELRYVEGKNSIEVRTHNLSEIGAIYEDVVASVALRSVHEIIAADCLSHIALVAFNGIVRTADPSTLAHLRPCLISVEVTTERFVEIDLRIADKKSCLISLGARLSPNFAELVPVKPLVRLDTIGLTAARNTLYVYTRPEHIPPAPEVLDWFLSAEWDRIVAHSIELDYSPKILPRTRNTLAVIASVLGECPDKCAVGALRGMLDSIYSEIREGALRSLAKTGDEADLSLLLKIAPATHSELAAYCEARLSRETWTGDVTELVTNVTLLAESRARSPEEKLRAAIFGETGPTMGLGRTRWLLECAVESREMTPDSLAALTRCCLMMDDWAHVLTLRNTANGRPPDCYPKPLKVELDYAAALLMAGAQTRALGHLRPLYQRLPKEGRPRANRILWRALCSNRFIGETHYLWALEVLLGSIVEHTSARPLLHDLHALARVLGALGQIDIAEWLTGVVRDAPISLNERKRANYVDNPPLDASFQTQIMKLFDIYKPIIMERLTIVLRSERSAPSTNPSIS